MPADVWLKKDVANILLGTAYALQNVAVTDPSFRAGVTATLTSLAISFGLRPSDILTIADTPKG